MRGSRRRGCIPKLQQKTSLCLHVSFSISNLGINLSAVVAKTDELPDWERARQHSGGKQQKLGFTEQMSAMKGSMCAPLLSPPVVSLT